MLPGSSFFKYGAFTDQKRVCFFCLFHQQISLCIFHLEKVAYICKPRCDDSATAGMEGPKQLHG